MKYILIYNWKCQNDDWFKIQLIKAGNEVIIIDNPDDGEIRYKKWYRIINFFECIMMALKSIRTDKEYIIVSMCATPGIIASILDRKKHKIIALNLLCHSKSTPSLGQKLRDLFYKTAFYNTNLYATCNEEHNKDEYIKKFNIIGDERLIILEDAIIPEKLSKIYPSDNYIFSGGASARDWNTLIKCAKKTPNQQYHICARETDWPSGSKLENIKVNFNIPKEKFNEDMLHSKIVLLALNSDVTAGLLVLFNAINQGKIVICTDTMTTRKFIPVSLHNKLLCQMFDSDDMKEKIQWAMNLDNESYIQIVTELQTYIYNHFSTDSYMKKFLSWIMKITDEV